MRIKTEQLREKLHDVVGYWNYTVYATYAGFAAGLLGIRFAALAQPGAAVLCLLIAGFFDMIDGRIARAKTDRTRDEKRFGVQIDSLSDLVCFGVLPAMIGHAIGLRHWTYTVLLVLYVLAGLIRLAYFNVMSAAEEEASSQGRMAYRGIPITASALVFPLIYALRSLDGSGIGLCLFYAVFMLLTGAAFLAPVTLKKPHGAAVAALAAVGLLTVVLLLVRGL